MKHTVRTDEEIAASGLLQEGIYDFEITLAEEKVSKNGADMFALKLNVFESDGSARVIRDWVLPDFPKKYKHLHDACGLLALYNSGETKPSDLEGKSGKLLLGIGKPYTDNNGNERVNNTVLDYIKRENATASSAKKEEIEEIPF